MAQPGRSSGGGERERRGGAGGDPRKRHPQSRGAGKDVLLRIAEELEEQGRALLARARELRRLATPASPGKAGAESPRERPARGEASRRREEAPEWAPRARRRGSP
jgi:hypothetical protein